VLDLYPRVGVQQYTSSMLRHLRSKHPDTSPNTVGAGTSASASAGASTRQGMLNVNPFAVQDRQTHFYSNNIEEVAKLSKCLTKQ